MKRYCYAVLLICCGAMVTLGTAAFAQQPACQRRRQLDLYRKESERIERPKST